MLAYTAVLTLVGLGGVISHTAGLPDLAFLAILVFASVFFVPMHSPIH